ncbi:thiamine pyrophosphate-binding protein [Egibacter rhizosphaerae]|uniref:Thiamine pyrophosphate-binding protein n=1 Tax=Egibacter rhizosphaerae TaxID=1670831 RepID=A0A411YI82_9ACTN|nr:thiamine pyrophosphate-dependent enzyme [Egibacter rhizosphaerae]QBI20806.1 thiamine pyrophosphate-binding protein [Egibacter rhizosphaerae]
MTAAIDAAVAQLVAAGVRRAYTVPGESFLPLLDALDAHPAVQVLSTRHESGAGFMAEAEAKVTGAPAVVLATRGVGASNLSIAVHTARQDSTPMVVLLGQVSTQALGREAFQEIDLPTYYGEVTKGAWTVEQSERLPEQIARAVLTAISGRPGPTMLALPEDVLDSDPPVADGWRPGVEQASRPTLDAATARAVADLLGPASSPVLIAGGGAGGAREALVAFAEAFGVGVYAAFRRQDVFPNEHPNYLGHLTLGAPAETLATLHEADVVLVVGSRLSEVTTQAYTLPTSGQTVVQIDIDPSVVGAVRPVAIGAVADAEAALRALLAHAPESSASRGTRTSSLERGHEAFLAASTPSEPSDGPIHPAEVMAALGRVFPPTTIVTNDAGNFSVFAHRYWRFAEPGTQVGPTSGAMGYGVPAAIGAQLARPEGEVVALAGDGGFLMTGQELETAVRYELPITVVVFRNGLYGTIALHQGRKLGRTAAVGIGQVDLAAVARGYGATAWQVNERAELEDALWQARRSGRPALVDVVVDSDVLTPAASLSDLLGTERAR